MCVCVCVHVSDHFLRLGSLGLGLLGLISCHPFACIDVCAHVMSMHSIAICVCVCVCLQLSSNQSFYRQIISYGMSVDDRRVA